MFSHLDFLIEAKTKLIKPPAEAISPKIKLSETGSDILYLYGVG